MKTKLSSSLSLALGIACSSLFIALPVHAEEQHWQHGEQARGHDAHARQAWVKQGLDKEATILEIRPSQQAAWDEYAAATLEVAASFKDDMQGKTSESLDAAGLLRQRADHLTEAAKNVSKLADATEKLQAVLSTEQRTVLKRLVAHHGFAHGHHFAHGGKKLDAEVPAAAGKPQAQKSK